MQFEAGKRQLLNAAYNLVDLSRKCVELTKTHGVAHGLFGSEEEVQSIKSLKKQSWLLQSKLQRGHVKIVVAGRTNCGKSTVINALLGKEILPTDPGHVTNCMIYISGIRGEQPKLTKKDMTTGEVTEIAVAEISNIAHAVQSGHDQNEVTLHLQIPKRWCRLFSKDIVLVDMPGFAYNTQLDAWLREECLDCDAFVLVVNALNPLDEPTMDFVHNLHQRFVGKPDVFVVFNRWDTFVEDARGNANLVTRNHSRYESDAKQLLVDRLEIATESSAFDFVFFTSALDVLKLRVHGRPKEIPQRGYWRRVKAFEPFEKSLIQRGSNLALLTKVSKHCDSICETRKLVLQWIESVLENVQRAMLTKAALEEGRGLLAVCRTSLANTLNAEFAKAYEGNIKKVVHAVVSYRCPISPDQDIERCKNFVYERMKNVLIENQEVHAAKKQLDKCLKEMVNAAVERTGECLCLCSPDASSCRRGSPSRRSTCPEVSKFVHSLLYLQMQLLSDLKLNYDKHVPRADRFMADFHPDLTVVPNFAFDEDVIPLLPREIQETCFTNFSGCAKQNEQQENSLTGSFGIFSGLGIMNRIMLGVALVGVVASSVYEHFRSRDEVSAVVREKLFVWHFVNFAVAKLRSEYLKNAIVQEVVNDAEKRLSSMWEQLDEKLEECLSAVDVRSIDLNRLRSSLEEFQGHCCDIDVRLQVFREQMDGL